MIAGCFGFFLAWLVALRSFFSLKTLFNHFRTALGFRGNSTGGGSSKKAAEIRVTRARRTYAPYRKKASCRRGRVRSVFQRSFSRPDIFRKHPKAVRHRKNLPVLEKSSADNTPLYDEGTTRASAKNELLCGRATKTACFTHAFLGWATLWVWVGLGNHVGLVPQKRERDV